MDECEALIRSIAARMGIGLTLGSRGLKIDLTGPWQRLSVEDAFRRHGTLSMKEALERDLFDEVMVQDIEPRLGLGKPTLLCDYPAERGALACLKEEDPSLAERFELYVGGVEIANAFSELTDSEEQRRRFVAEETRRRTAGKRPYPMPEKFLEELDRMPPSAGVALGVDRLVMVLLDLPTIDHVVAFLPEEL
jgi:lysyl-tRNA synthetase class 2